MAASTNGNTIGSSGGTVGRSGHAARPVDGWLEEMGGEGFTRSLQGAGTRIACPHGPFANYIA